MIELWVVASLILIAGLVDDLRSRRVHNPLVVVAAVAGIAASLWFRGVDGSMTGAFAFLLALIATIPLFAAGMLGGGDVKLFAVFALVLEPSSMFWTLVYSVIWGALFGVTRATLQKQLPALVRATYRSAKSTPRVVGQTVHPIPYTFALLLGWFTELTWLHLGGGF